MKKWYMNEERELLQQAFREFAQTRVRPHVADMEFKEADARELLMEMGELGFFGLTIDEKFGGSGEDWINWALFLEEVSKESYTVAFLAAIEDLFHRHFIRGGAEKPGFMEKYILPAVRGEILLGMAQNEECSAVDIFNYVTVAKKDGDEWIVNGEKQFITMADIADYIFVAARVKEADELAPGEDPFNALEYFVIPMNAEGVTVGHIENKVGWNGSGTGTIYYNNVRVPESDRLDKFHVGLDDFGADYGVMALGGCEVLLEKTTKYLKERIAFGVSLWDAHESIRNEVAALTVKVNNLRNAIYGHLMDMNNGNAGQEGAVAYKVDDIAIEGMSLKIEGNKLLQEVSIACMQLMGGPGIVREAGIERYYRDVAPSQIGCTSDKTALSMIGLSL